ncbi:MAG TPA: DUF11 domain-containing protein [Solirubrobacteraceae bacterium]|nr:DUF11 domain-containing protein [Solirubrobacteraceae bacterium]
MSDTDGPNDEPVQKDLTQFGRDDSDPNAYKIFWSWDETNVWTGAGQTGDACALFDTDGDSFINFVVCGQIHNADSTSVTETATSPLVFSCSDGRIDNCTNPVGPIAYTAEQIQSGAITPVGAPAPSPPADLATATDPFPAGSTSPYDTTLELIILKSFLPPNAVLVNVCSYPSLGNGFNNDPSDCIVNPGGGFLRINKVAPAGTTQVFSFGVNPGATTHTITGSGQTSAISLPIAPSGTLASVAETVPSGWVLDSASCVRENGPATGTKTGNTVGGIMIESGKITDCTFTNSQPPALSITKTRDAATVSAGTAIGFTLTATNTGTGPAQGVQITDVLPAGAGLSWSVDGGSAAGTCSIAAGTLTCNVGTLAAGATATVHITSSTTAATCGTVDNTGRVTATNTSGVAPSSSSVAVQCPDLGVRKVADAGAVSAGDAIGFTITVRNDGPGTATGVTISDPLPTGTGISWSIDGPGSDTGCTITANTLSCSFDSLAAGVSKHVHVTSPTTSASCKSYDNTATADASNDAAVEATASTTVNCGDIGLTKVADAATVSAGDRIGFVITATNKGTGEARTVTVTDTLPATAGLNWSIASQPAGDPCAIADGVLTCNFGTLAGGASRQVHITSATTSASCATINNQAAVRTSNDGSAQAGDSTTVNCGDIALTKVADATSVTAGSQIGFVMTATNGGSGEARNVTLTDRLPTTAGLNWSIAIGSASGCSIAGGTLTCNWGTLASRASKSVHITSPTTMASCARINNSASVSTSNDGSDEANASTSVKCGAIAIDKTGAATAQAGQPVLYTLVVTNPGQVPFLAPNVNVADALCDAPPLLLTKNGDASPDQLDPGDQWTYTCTVQTQVGQTVVNNVGVVAATDSNGNVLQDDDPATTQLTQPPVVTPPAEEVTPPPAPVTPSGTPVPVAAVLPVQIATARLSGPKRCVSGPFEAKVIGRGIAKVVFLLDGRRLKTVNGNAIRTVFKVLINPRGRAGFAHRVTARVTFRTATKKPARTLRLTYLGCPRKIAAPQFTG